MEMYEIKSGKYKGQFGIITEETAKSVSIRICSPEFFYDDVNVKRSQIVARETVAV